MHDLSGLLLALVAVLLLAKLLGVLAQRVGQPAVLGELLAGVLLGRSMIGLLHPDDPVIHALAELGVLILLFEIGLHTDVRSLAKVGGSAAAVGAVGVVLPLALGYGVCRALGVGALASTVCGAALTATSIGISARVLADLGQLETREGQVVLGAAVLDDVAGLIILSVVGGLASGEALTGTGVARITVVALAFVIAAYLVGRLIAPPMIRRVARYQPPGGGVLGPVGFAFALMLALLAEVSGSAMIIGAFAAGLVLHDTPQRQPIERSVTTLGHYVVPIFFAVVGAAVDLTALANASILAIGAALFAVGVLGKVAAGYAPWWFHGRKLLIGVAMVPRGEVGLIFAQLGLARGVLDVRLFSALTLMVMATTFIAPPALSRLSVRRARDVADARGVSELVSGATRDA